MRNNNEIIKNVARAVFEELGYEYTVAPTYVSAHVELKQGGLADVIVYGDKRGSILHVSPQLRFSREHFAELSHFLHGINADLAAPLWVLNYDKLRAEVKYHRFAIYGALSISILRADLCAALSEVNCAHSLIAKISLGELAAEEAICQLAYTRAHLDFEYDKNDGLEAWQHNANVFGLTEKEQKGFIFALGAKLMLGPTDELSAREKLITSISKHAKNPCGRGLKFYNDCILENYKDFARVIVADDNVLMEELEWTTLLLFSSIGAAIQESTLEGSFLAGCRFAAANSNIVFPNAGKQINAAGLFLLPFVSALPYQQFLEANVLTPRKLHDTQELISQIVGIFLGEDSELLSFVGMLFTQILSQNTAALDQPLPEFAKWVIGQRIINAPRLESVTLATPSSPLELLCDQVQAWGYDILKPQRGKLQELMVRVCIVFQCAKNTAANNVWNKKVWVGTLEGDTIKFYREHAKVSVGSAVVLYAMSDSEKEKARLLHVITEGRESLSPAVNCDFGLLYHNMGESKYLCALKHYMTAAKQGSLTGEYCSAIMFFKGMGVKKDSKKAIHWASKAAVRGLADAQTLMGDICEDFDMEKSVAWHTLAAMQGNVQSQTRLGLAYQHGEGVIASKIEAVRWFKAAANNVIPSAPAAFNLGLLFTEELYTDTIRAKLAIKCFERAASLGHKTAQLVLSERDAARAGGQSVFYITLDNGKGLAYPLPT